MKPLFMNLSMIFMHPITLIDRGNGIRRHLKLKRLIEFAAIKKLNIIVKYARNIHYYALIFYLLL